MLTQARPFRNITPKQQKFWLDLTTFDVMTKQRAGFRVMIGWQLAQLDQSRKVILTIPSLEAKEEEGKRCS